MERICVRNVSVLVAKVVVMNPQQRIVDRRSFFMGNQMMIWGLFGLDEEESVTAFDCHLDSPEFLL